MIFIVTRTCDQAEYMARYDLGLDSKYAWKWVRDPQDLRGVGSDDNSVVFGVGFYQRVDALEIIEIVRSRDLPIYPYSEEGTETE